MPTRSKAAAKIKSMPSIDQIIRIMTDRYGPFAEEPRLDAAHEIVFTILSQHTSDTNSSRAYHLLMDKFGTLEEVARGEPSDIESTIAPGGLAKIKAPRIKQVLNLILELNGSLDLSFLRELPLDEAKAWLRQLPGIGPKSAGIILSFALGMPAMAIDTHIYRVSKRLALIGPKVTADKAHDILEAVVDPDQVYPFHLAFITHGRQVCKAQRPLCGECVVAEACPSREQFMAPTEAPQEPSKKAARASAKGQTKKTGPLPHSVAIKE
ncbi:MAG TPA: endonuclease III [Dehalococcoidia bacterium]|nr:endonuclease III [Dehalococcoidia bacterium]